MAENVEEAPSSPRVLQGSEQKKETFIKLKPKMIKELKLNSELNGKLALAADPVYFCSLSTFPGSICCFEFMFKRESAWRARF